MNTKKSSLLATLGAAGLFALSLVGASPAAAAVPDEKLPEQHCFVYSPSDGAREELVCAESDAALDRVALDNYNLVILREGIYTDEDLAKAQAEITEQYADLGGVTPQAIVVTGEVWFGASYTGSSIIVTSSYSCSNPFTQTYYSNLTAFSGGNDNIESSKTFGGCYMRLWENASKGGTLFGPVNYDIPSMGSFNNKASSLCVSASSSC